MAIRIAVASDLHLEFEPDYWAKLERQAGRGDSSFVAAALGRRAELRDEQGHPDSGPDLRGLHERGVDLLLLAGDIHLGTGGVGYAAAAARYLGCPAALLVAGNHEAYGRDLKALIPALRDAAAETGGLVRFLENDRIDMEFRGRRVAVLGATLWTDYLVNGNELAGMRTADQRLNDHRVIKFGGNRFTAAQARAIHHETRTWLAREVPRARQEADVVIVMTHHAPIPEANPPQYRGGDLSPAFASDLRPQILEWQPDLWCFGHTHWSMREQVGHTLLVSAQRGYVGSEAGADSFVPEVVEL